MSSPPLRRVLLTGGARSGKSTLAERLVGPGPATYVATAPTSVDDDEWRQRVATHRARRPDTWETVESDDLPRHITAAGPHRPVLVDCLTLWLTARMDHHGVWTDPGAETAVRRDIDDLVDAVARCPGGLVLVTNEVGSGIVPTDPGTRLFRDLLGVTNSAVADVCDDVYLVVAGRRLTLERA